MRIRTFIQYFLLFLLAPSLAFGLTLQITWNANSETDLAGYKVYIGSTASGIYGTPRDVGNATICNITGIKDMTTYYVVVTAYDAAGNESGFSTEVFTVVPDMTSPSAPGIKLN